jgi:hypothetical protein
MPPSAVPPRGRRTGLIALIAAVVVLGGGGGALAYVLTRSSSPAAGSPHSTPSASPSPSPSPSPASGVAYTDPQGRWTATFAGTPSYHSTTTSTAGGPVPYMYAEYTGPDADQVVGVLLLPAGSTFDLAKGLTGLASSESGTVVSSQTGTFDGFASLEGVVNIPSGVLKCQVVRVGLVIYLFGTVGPVNPPSDYAAFVASIRLTPH